MDCCEDGGSLWMVGISFGFMIKSVHLGKLRLDDIAIVVAEAGDLWNVGSKMQCGEELLMTCETVTLPRTAVETWNT